MVQVGGRDHGVRRDAPAVGETDAGADDIRRSMICTTRRGLDDDAVLAASLSIAPMISVMPPLGYSTPSSRSRWLIRWYRLGASKGDPPRNTAG